MRLQIQRRRPVALLTGIAAAALLAGAGCGGDDEPSPEEAARAAADQFVSSFETGDFEAACGDLTDQLADQIGGEECPDRIASIAGQGEDLSISITNLRVSGPKAVAETEVSRAGSPPQESSFELVETARTWEVSKLGD